MFKYIKRGLFYLLSIVVLVGVFLLASIITAEFLQTQEANAQSVMFSTNLFYGMDNSQDVINLQTFLTAQNDYAGPISGNFYSLTKAGVIAFQEEHGLPTTGYFGVLSRGVANGIEAAQARPESLPDAQPTTTPATQDTIPATSTPSVSSTSTSDSDQNVNTNPVGHQTCVLQYYGTFNGIPQYFPQCTQSAPVSQGTGVSAPIVDEAPAASVLPVTPVFTPPQVTPPPMNPLPIQCTLHADTVTLRTGETVAAFGWKFTRGDVVDASLSGSVDGDVGALPSWNSANVGAAFYGPPITQDTTYTLTVTDGTHTQTCTALARI